MSFLFKILYIVLSIFLKGVTWKENIGEHDTLE